MMTTATVEQPANPTKIIYDEGSIQDTTPPERIKLLLTPENIVSTLHNYAISNGQLPEAKQQIQLPVNHFRPPPGIVVLNDAENKAVFSYNGATSQKPKSSDEKSVLLQIRPSHDNAIISNGSISSVIRSSTSLESDSPAKLPSKQTVHMQPTQSEPIVVQPAVQTQVKSDATMPVNFVRPQNIVANKVASKPVLKRKSSLEGEDPRGKKVFIISNETISNRSSSVVDPVNSRGKSLPVQVNTTRTTPNKKPVHKPNESMRNPTSPLFFKPPLPPRKASQPLNQAASKPVLKRKSSLEGEDPRGKKVFIISNEIIPKRSSSVVDPLNRREKSLPVQVNTLVNTTRTTPNKKPVHKPNESMRKPSSPSFLKPQVPLQMASQPLNKAIVIPDESIVSPKIPVLELPFKRNVNSTIDKYTILSLLPVGVTITRTYIDGHTESALLPDISIKPVGKDTEKKRFKTSFEDAIFHDERLIQMFKTNNVSVRCSSNKQRLFI